MDDEDRLELELAEDCTNYIEVAVVNAIRGVLGKDVGEFDIRCAICALIVLAADMHVQLDNDDDEIRNLLDIALESVRQEWDDQGD